MTEPRVLASLDLACFLQIVLARKSSLSSSQRMLARSHVFRAMAAMVDHPLPDGAAIDEGTALAAFEVVCASMAATGISYPDLVARFNQAADQYAMRQGKAS